MIGPGKYDAECTELREKTKAAGAIIIIIDGDRGQGFCVQAPLHLTLALPDLLRDMASQIEGDFKKGQL